MFLLIIDDNNEVFSKTIVDCLINILPTPMAYYSVKIFLDGLDF